MFFFNCNAYFYSIGDSHKLIDVFYIKGSIKIGNNK